VRYSSRFSRGTRDQSYSKNPNQPYALRQSLAVLPSATQASHGPRPSTPQSRNSHPLIPPAPHNPPLPHYKKNRKTQTHLIQIDNRLPELILQLVEIPHPNLSKVARVVFVEVRPVVVLSSCHTASTGIFSVLADTAVAGGDVAAAVKGEGPLAR